MPEASLLTDEKYKPILEILPRVEAETYDTLLGNQEREDGLFAGTKVSNMTINDLLTFSNSTSRYADYSRNLPGVMRMATPMGKYAIVGKTLKGLKEHFELTGNEIFTPELQDQFFLYLFHKTLDQGGSLNDKVTRLRGVWEGFKNVSNENLKNAIKNI